MKGSATPTRTYTNLDAGVRAGPKQPYSRKEVAIAQPELVKPQALLTMPQQKSPATSLLQPTTIRPPASAQTASASEASNVSFCI